MPATPQNQQQLLGNYYPSGSDYHVLLLNDDRSSFAGSASAGSATIALSGHNFVVGTRVVLAGYSGSALTNGTEYFVVAATSGVDIQVSATRTGVAIVADTTGSLSFAEQGLSQLIVTMADMVRREEIGYSGVRATLDETTAVIEEYQDSYKLTVEVTVDNSGNTALVEFEGIGVVRNGSSTKGDVSGEPWVSELLAGGPYEIRGQSSRIIPIAVTFAKA